MIRINRYIASCTTYSRRQAEGFIRRGEVSINGRKVTNLSTTIGPKDHVTLQGKMLSPLRMVYYVVHKPKGYTCSNKDFHATHLVTELVPAQPPVFNVGRLDKDSTGLIILTNDGELAYQLEHPKFEKTKVYEVTLTKALTAADREVLLHQGIVLPHGVSRFDAIKKIDSHRYQVVLHQGLNRQIRKSFSALGYEVLELMRVSIAGLSLQNLPVGSCRQLTRLRIMDLLSKKL